MERADGLWATLKRGARWLFSEKEGRAFLLWCLPALVIGFALRAALTVQMPYGYFQFDSPDFLRTPYKLLRSGDLVIHGKKTFLIPLLYTVPFLLRLPALIVIPLAQHALGLLFVLVMGALTRLWFDAWRVFILPVTLLTAVNPAMIWFEHSLMAETVYLFCIGALLLAGTLFFRHRTPGCYWLLLIAVALTAGARPEGRLLSAFALLLIGAAYFGKWRELAKRLGIALAVVAGLFAITPTSEGGSLLLASVIHLTPDHVRAAPGIEPFLLPTRDALRAKWQVVPKDVKKVEKNLGDVFDEYAAATGRKVDANKLSKRIALAACVAHPLALPRIAVNKFLVGVDAPSAGAFDEYWLQKKQQRAYEHGEEQNLFLSRGMSGRAAKTADDLNAFVREHYRPVGWFNALHRAWFFAIGELRPAGTVYAQLTLPGLPYFFALAALGLLASALRPGEFWPVRIAACGMWCGLFAVNFLAGPLNQRYRFIFEPAAVFYLFFLFDCLVAGAWLLFRSKKR